jgi:hypothetical protein
LPMPSLAEDRDSSMPPSLMPNPAGRRAPRAATVAR